MSLVRRHLRSEPVERAALIAGISAAAAAFVVLCMNASALTVQVNGRLPAGSPRRTYDILVRVPSRVAQLASGDSLARPTDLAELSGGITLAQYDTIRRLPGVQVAAPMTMVGYVPLTVVIPIAVPASALTSTPAVFSVTAQQRSDDGLTTVTERNIGTTYVTASPVCPSAQVAVSSVAPRLVTCWSTTSGPDRADWSGSRPATISVPLSWTFLLPLVAVDPAAEARLLHLDRAVTQGSYLPATGVTRTGPVPMIIASSIDDGAEDSLTLSELPASAASRYASGLSPAQIDALLEATTGRVVDTTDTVTAGLAYRDLLGYLRGHGPASVPAYWTPGPAHYTTAADGTLTPQSVSTYGMNRQVEAAAAAVDVGFRTLTPHAAVSLWGGGADGTQSSHVAALHAIGVFDPTRIASSAATPSPYLGERLTGADARSRRLLGGGTLAPDGNPAGYPSPGATLVMPLQDIAAFTAAGAYTHTDDAAPIGSIRVRVDGATGDDPLSQARVRLVAQEIVRATGLHVDVTLAASAATRTIDLPVGRDGRPALRLTEIWYRSDTRTTVSAGVDPRSIALAAAVLVVGSAFVISGSAGALLRRRRELATLRALGWRRRYVAGQLVREFALIAATAGTLAVVLSFVLDAAIGSDPATGWPLMSLPAAAVMTVAAAWWQVRRATAEPGSAPERLGTAFGGVVVTAACAVLGLELTVRWVFGGAVVGSWLGVPFSWQDDPVDLAAVLTIVALATLTVTDISWFDADERAVELRTLRALGWPSRGVARVAVGEAALFGLTGGVAASVLDIGGVLMVVHRMPAGLLPVVAVVIGTGVAITLLAAGLPAAARACRTKQVADAR